MSDLGTEDQDDDTGRSSPFVNTPSNGVEEHEMSLIDNRAVINNFVNNEDAMIHSLQFKLDTQKNEFELEKLQLQREYTELDKKCTAALNALGVAQESVQITENKLVEAQDEIADWKTKYLQLEAAMKTKLNEADIRLQQKERSIKELTIDKEAEMNKLELSEENNKVAIASLKTSLERYENTIKSQADEIATLHKTINKKDGELETLNQQLMGVSATNNIGAADDSKSNVLDELTSVNRLFQEQIRYTTELEETNMKQMEKIKVLENSQYKIDQYQSKIDLLQKKVQELESLEKDYQDSQLELLELKAKVAEWELYPELNNNNNKCESDEDHNVTPLNNPVETIRDLTLTKKENTMLIDENNKLNINVNNLKILNEELALERNQLLDLNKNYENNIINLKRLNHEYEQQKILISEECKILRNRLKEYTDIDMTNGRGIKVNPSASVNDYNNSTIQNNLENLVDDYKNKTDGLTNELKKLNQQMLATTEEENNQKKKKRKLADPSQSNNLTYYSQRINELQLENAKLARDLGKYQNLNRLLDEKLKRLIMLKEKKIRILQLRDNPLNKDQFIKKQQLELLKRENYDLLTALKSASSELEIVPLSVVKTMEFNLNQNEKELYKSNKKFVRLKEIFNKKSLEFIEVVNSILGFKLEFQQNNKVKIYSCFRPNKYLVVDLINNTLVSNLNLSNWDDLLSVWIEQREQIPCFLATITLQLWQESLS